MARCEGVPGWHAMRKDELVAALVRTSRRNRAKHNKSAPAKHRGAANGQSNGASAPAERPSPARRRVQQQILELQQRQSELKNLGSTSSPRNGSAADGRSANGKEQGGKQQGGKEPGADRLVVLVRDPYWLHVCWELTTQSVQRAKSALGQHWHTAKPVLRLFRVVSDGGIDGGTDGASKLVRTIDIHGGVSNWYVDVYEPPCTYRTEIGYESPAADFFCLARSNTVTTPAPGSAETIDRNWSDVADNADRIYAMSGGYSADGASLELQELLEERLRRRLGRPAQTRFGAGAAKSQDGELRLAIDAELVVYGSTDPHSHVTVKGEPVEVRPDGTFAVKMHLPDRRQVVPVVAGSSDGAEQKTVILGVERNTKVLDPMARETVS